MTVSVGLSCKVTVLHLPDMSEHYQRQGPKVIILKASLLTIATPVIEASSHKGCDTLQDAHRTATQATQQHLI